MSTQKNSISVLTIFIMLALALLVPGLTTAGSLEPSDPPGPTMRTLDEIYTRPVWDMFDKTFTDWPDNPRFSVCDNGTPENTGDDMVLDKETGLVWVRDPSLLRVDIATQPLTFPLAHIACSQYPIVGRPDGWRLPTLPELSTLIDRTHYNPALPSGHPFINVNTYSSYWTVTPTLLCGGYLSDTLYRVGFSSGYKNCAHRDDEYYVWCVRGGQGSGIELLLLVK
jgi:hypothetical protein